MKMPRENMIYHRPLGNPELKQIVLRVGKLVMREEYSVKLRQARQHH